MPLDSYETLAIHLHKAQRKLNEGALTQVRHAVPEDREKLLTDLASVLFIAALATSLAVAQESVQS